MFKTWLCVVCLAACGGGGGSGDDAGADPDASQTLVDAAIADAAVPDAEPPPDARPPLPCEQVTNLFSGTRGICAQISGESTLLCWGEVGFPTPFTLGAVDRVPAPMPDVGQPILEIAQGGRHNCYLLADHTVLCEGDNSQGQLGLGDTAFHPASVVPGLDGVSQLVAIGDTNCALLDDTTVECWGRNGSGMIGDGTFTGPRKSPTAVLGLSGVARLSTTFSGPTVCAILQDTSEVCWGDDQTGQLGNDAERLSKNTAQPVATLTGVVRIAGSCAVLGNGELWSWGLNDHGQVGDGTNEIRTTPVQVPGITDATDVVVGRNFACAIVGGGQVRCWGDGEDGLFADADEGDRLVPTLVPGVTDAVQLAATQRSMCARTAHGSVTCWGFNNQGQAGNGTYIQAAPPADVNMCQYLGCGNGMIDPLLETCDDGNLDRYDGCFACMEEPRAVCRGEPSSCIQPLNYLTYIEVAEEQIVGHPEAGMGPRVDIRTDVFGEFTLDTGDCLVKVRTPAELDHPVGEGVFNVARFGACALERGEYVCTIAAGAGATMVMPLGDGTAAISVTGQALDQAAAHGPWLELAGLGGSNDGKFPIVSYLPMGVAVIANPAATTQSVASASYRLLGGAGPVPGTVEPGFISDLDEASFDLTPGYGGHMSDLSDFTSNTGGVGDHVTLDTATQARMTAIPMDGSAFTLGCDGAGGSACTQANGNILRVELETTDGDVTGLPFDAMPAAVNQRVFVRCNTFGNSANHLQVPAAVSALLASSGATRIRTRFLKAGGGFVSNFIAGHSWVGYTDVP